MIGNVELTSSLAVFAAVASFHCAFGQGLTTDNRPSVGGAGGLQAPAKQPLLFGSENGSINVHRSPVGKPCLTVHGVAKSQKINPHIFEHVVVAANDCSQPIKLQICYFQSEHCVPAEVPGYGHKETFLGIMPAADGFRFEYREKFDHP